MSEKDIPITNPDPEATPGEFDFTKPPEENPRVRRRSLKTKLKPAAGVPVAARELVREAPPVSTTTTRPEPRHDDEVEIPPTSQPAVEPPPARPTYASTAKPSQPSATSRPAPTVNHTTSPHGTRPATLYYSTGSRKEKEETPPMKSTTTATPPPSSTAAATSSAAPRSTIAPASSVRPTGVVDYRTNVERQAREQKSVGGILSILVYTLIGLFVVGAALAGYGAYVVHQALHDQSITVTQLDARYAAANKDLNVKLASTLDTLTQAQAQIGRQQELILKQQESINKLLTTTQDTAAAVRQEKATRAEETSSLRARVKDLEYQGPSTRKY